MGYGFLLVDNIQSNSNYFSNQCSLLSDHILEYNLTDPF